MIDNYSGLLYNYKKVIRGIDMISDIKVDLSAMKSILFDVIEQYKYLFFEKEDAVLLSVFEGYEPKDKIDTTQLKSYQHLFATFYSDKIKSLAIYNSDDKNSFDHQKVTKLEQEGKVFTNTILRVLKKQLYLEQRIEQQNNLQATLVISKVIEHLGNNYYFAVEKSTLECFFEYAVFLYLSDRKILDFKDVEAISIVHSMKSLSQYSALQYEMKYGDIYFSDSSDKDIQCMIEKLISHIGGIDFLRILFFEHIKPKYNSRIDRFLIHRNMRQLLRSINETRIPYNYLIQLAAKHLDKARNILLTNKGQKIEFDKAVRISRDYLNVMNLQPYSVFGDMCLDFKSIPVRLSRNILFEKMFTPIQYCPNFVDEFIQKIYLPFFNHDIKTGYSRQEFETFYKMLISEKDICMEYTFDDLRKRTQLKSSSLKKLLGDFSIESNYVNSNFDNFLSQTNYRSRPLVKLKNNHYFLFSAYFNGFSIAETLYEKLKAYYPGNFNRLKGENVENMIKNLLIAKGFSFGSGEYTVDKTTKYECDMVLESDKKIVFIEIKNQPLPDTFEQGDDIETLRSLGEGMIKAQRQCYRHVSYLKKQGQLTLRKADGSTYTVKENNRRIVCVSLCSQEYLFLTNKLFSSNFLQSLLISTYHATDPKKENRLTNLKALRNELEVLVQDIYGQVNLQQAFFDTLFRSAQQIYTILNVSKTINDFIHYLTEPIYVSDGSNDVYHQLITSMRMNIK